MKRSLFIVVTLWIGCGDDKPKTCTVGTSNGCAQGQVCENYTDTSGMHAACFAPTQLRGIVTNAQSAAPIAGARVVAIDGDSHAAVSPVALSDASGHYAITVFAPRAANSEKQFTVR